DSKGGALGFDCCLASPKFRVFQQPARAIRANFSMTCLGKSAWDLTIPSRCQRCPIPSDAAPHRLFRAVGRRSRYRALVRQAPTNCLESATSPFPLERLGPLPAGVA